MPVVWDPKYRGVMNLWGLAGQGGWASPPPPGYVRPEDSAMAKIFWPAAKSMTSGVIDTIADRLSGARALRGVLTGKPRELLSVVPESDYFGLTDPTQNKSFGFWGDMLVRPDVAKLASHGVKAAYDAARSALVPAASAIAPNIAGAMAQKIRPITPEEMEKAYAGWASRITPEQEAELATHTGHGFQYLSPLLRKLSGAEGEFNPFRSIGHLGRGEIKYNTPEELLARVPAIDKVVESAVTPRSIKTYRAASQLGELGLNNPERVVGRTISDPAYLSTSINPFNNYYNRDISPNRLYMDLELPKGTKGAYSGLFSSTQSEAELTLPRNLPLTVKSVKDVPYKQLDYTGYRFDPSGKPVPEPRDFSPYFTESFRQNYPDLIKRFQNDPLKMVIPDEFMVPNWRDLVARDISGEGIVKHVSLTAPKPTGVLPKMPRTISGSNLLAPVENSWSSIDPGDLPDFFFSDPKFALSKGRRIPDYYGNISREVKNKALAALSGMPSNVPKQLESAPSEVENIMARGGGNPSMMRFLRPTRMYKELPSGEMRGVGGPRNLDPKIESTLGSMAERHPLRGETFGFYEPGSDLGWAGINYKQPGYAAVYQMPEERLSESVPFWNTVRHERVHSAIDQAVKNPEMIGDLPIPLRVPARLNASKNPFLRGTGYWAEEATARGLGERGFYPQTSAASDFLFNDTSPLRAWYKEEVKKISPTAAQVFSALPVAADISKAAPGVLLLNAIRNGGEPMNTEGL